MDVILLERVENLGQMGEVVTVKNGYARNFLLPQKKALRASKESLVYFETQKAQLEAQNLQRKSEAETVGESMAGMTVVLIRQAGDTGQLYGSVSSRDVAEAVTDAGSTIDRRQVQLEKPIKELGLHEISLRLHPEVDIGITVNVARSVDEAEAQARGENVLTRADEFEFDDEDDAELDALLGEAPDRDDDLEDTANDEGEKAD
jgi:large subunit ribosomal protein L9